MYSVARSIAVKLFRWMDAAPHTTVVAAVCLCITAGVFQVTEANEGFRSLESIKNPGPRIKFADNFNRLRILWLFPFLNFTQSNIITGWVFRARTSQSDIVLTQNNTPSFELREDWRSTPDLRDYRCLINKCNMAVSLLESNFMGSPSVYKQLLKTPLVIKSGDQYILGIRLPPPGDGNLNLAFEMETTDRLSYYFESYTSLATIRNTTYEDNHHIPLVTPLFGSNSHASTVLPTASLTESSISENAINRTGVTDKSTSAYDNTKMVTTTTTSKQRENNSLYISVGVVLPVVILISLTVFIISVALCLRRRRKKKLITSENVSYHSSNAQSTMTKTPTEQYYDDVSTHRPHPPHNTEGVAISNNEAYGKLEGEMTENLAYGMNEVELSDNMAYTSTTTTAGGGAEDEENYIYL